ncbi:MAG TPA: Minf_1886 family protein [Terriglobales bacterium]|nr:Minf_1886 family protein [Terriglobales bacterium]
MSPSDRPLHEDRSRGGEDPARDGRPRYPREACVFVVLAMDAVAARLPAARARDPQRRHLSGREVLEGVVRLAREQFGPMASTVFREWGVLGGEDVGRIVFALVRSGEVKARPEDSPEDFGGFDLFAALTEKLEVGAPLFARGRHRVPRRRPSV